MFAMHSLKSAVIKSFDSEKDSQNRVLRVIVKGGEKQGKESKGAIVPRLTDGYLQTILNNPAGFDAFRNLIEGVQEKLARQVYDAGRETLTQEDIGVDAIIGYLTAENAVARFSKEAIAGWFAADMAAPLAAALSAKGMQEVAIEKISGVFLAAFQSLAGRNVSMSDDIKAQLEKCLALLPEGYENPVAERIAEKLAEVRSASNMLDAL